jgi:hypothetical protein
MSLALFAHPQSEVNDFREDEGFDFLDENFLGKAESTCCLYEFQQIFLSELCLAQYVHES